MARDEFTIGWVIDTGATLQWKCTECGGHGNIDPKPISRAKGWTFSMMDQHPPCRAADCLGRVTFYVGLGLRWTPMYSQAALQRALIASCYPEAQALTEHGWRIAAGRWTPPAKKPPGPHKG